LSVFDKIFGVLTIFCLKIQYLMTIHLERYIQVASTMILRPQNPLKYAFFRRFLVKMAYFDAFSTKIGIFGLASSESGKIDKITSEIDYLYNFTPKTDGTKLKPRPVNHPNTISLHSSLPLYPSNLPLYPTSLPPQPPL